MINVTVQNKLKEKLHVRVNKTAVASSPIVKGKSLTFELAGYSASKEIVELEVEYVLSSKIPTSYPWPVCESSPGVEVSISADANKVGKWTMKFSHLIDEQSLAKAEPTNNTNVTVGADEPTQPISTLASTSLITGGVAAGLLAGPFLKTCSPYLWGGLTALFGIISIVTGIMSRNKNTSETDTKRSDSLTE